MVKYFTLSPLPLETLLPLPLPLHTLGPYPQGFVNPWHSLTLERSSRMCHPQAEPSGLHAGKKLPPHFATGVPR